MAIVAGFGFVVAVGLFLNTARHLKGWAPDEDIPAEPVKSPAHAPNLGPAVADEGVV